MMSTMDNLPKEDARSGDIHVVVLVKGRERYAWFWDDDNFAAAVTSVLRLLASKELSLMSVDAFHMIDRMAEMQMESEAGKLPR